MLLSQMPILDEAAVKRKKKKFGAKSIVEQFHGSYCLVSLSELRNYKNKCYIGYTVDPNNRIRQHNGGKEAGGAKKTSGRGPWNMVCIVHGFPNSCFALHFEWAWQNPHKSRRLKDLNIKQTKEETHFQFKIRVCMNLLNSEPWSGLCLTFRWLLPQYKLEFPSPFLPSHVKEAFGLVELKKISVSQDPSLYQNIGSCYICKKEINATETLARCVERSKCGAKFHIICLADSILAGDPNVLIPVKGKCPKCRCSFMWGDIIKDTHHLVKMESLKPSMEDGSKKIIVD
uniref:Structure-specific endonuclease subunit SLX1 homolog n=1 Tax=Rhabditophanes sp. KR3021 TaxID=114890 RepID=A0AC35U0N4_9BILA